MKPSRALSAALLLAFSALAPAQEASDIEYRDFAGPGGKPIQAVVVDKTGTDVVLLLKNGKRTTVPLDKLIPLDREYVNSWSKEKAIFLQKCRTLSIRQLLELRGYESFPFRFESNSIFMDGSSTAPTGNSSSIPVPAPA
jgi:hypothetical protein